MNTDKLMNNTKSPFYHLKGTSDMAMRDSVTSTDVETTSWAREPDLVTEKKVTMGRRKSVLGRRAEGERLRDSSF